MSAPKVKYTPPHDNACPLENRIVKIRAKANDYTAMKMDVTQSLRQNGRFPPNPLAISKNLNDQPAPQLPKPTLKPDRETADWRWHCVTQGGQNLRVFPKPSPASM
jgi:hypothetical protein